MMFSLTSSLKYTSTAARVRVRTSLNYTLYRLIALYLVSKIVTVQYTTAAIGAVSIIVHSSYSENQPTHTPSLVFGLDKTLDEVQVLQPIQSPHPTLKPAIRLHHPVAVAFPLLEHRDSLYTPCRVGLERR